MISKLVNFIKATNGDILGVLLFILLLIYFFLKDPPYQMKILLIIGCSFALLVDGYIVFKTLNAHSI